MPLGFLRDRTRVEVGEGLKEPCWVGLLHVPWLDSV